MAVSGANGRDMKNFFHALLLPLAIIIAIRIAGFGLGLVPGTSWPTWMGTLFEVVAWLAYCLAGWLIVGNGVGNLLVAFLSGIVILFIEAVIQGGLLMLVPFFDSRVSLSDARWAFFGTFASFFIFSPIYVAASLLGGIASKILSPKGTAH